MRMPVLLTKVINEPENLSAKMFGFSATWEGMQRTIKSLLPGYVIAVEINDYYAIRFWLVESEEAYNQVKSSYFNGNLKRIAFYAVKLEEKVK